ncbi:hypothetical protein SAMN04488515_2717 [Cognatiyoonia koreensis]|uniref:Uncharacterized protein n=1 Tax=Cognatiyoonia koreensis TaxID=364200 RepID=A0A1I0RHZ2_9RHOB|nr:hypothetical protein [Cognatiyoonia koreensis]SEW40527.1 hypothetical protein SAMN04488515_2717 [Cognatiyoonia koreensis]
MFKYSNHIFGALGVTLLVACGGTSIEKPPGDKPGDKDGPEPNPTTFSSAAEVQEQRNFINGGFRLDETGPIAGVRNGAATYQGHWATGLTVNGEPDINAMFGDVRMVIDVGGGKYPVSGTITNFNTVNGNEGLEALDGSLAISGQIGGLDKEFEGTTFDGTLTGFFGGDSARSVEIDADVTGEMRNRSGFGNNGSTVTGRTTGDASFVTGGGGIDITTGQFRADRDNN